MAELSGEHLIEVREGAGKPPIVRVRPGEQIGPMSLGAEGAWRLEAPGVSREHAEIFFDGKQLFVRSLSAVVPVLVAGRPVPNAWTPIEPPCELMLGEARLWFGPDLGTLSDVNPGRGGAAAKAGMLEDDDNAATGIAELPDPIALRARARAGMLEDDDNVATSVAEPSARPWGDVSALVQRGIGASRGVSSGAPPLVPPPPPVPPTPPPPPMPGQGPFWPAAAAAPEPAVAGDAEAPSNTRRTDDSGVTRIEPVEQVRRRPGESQEHALTGSGGYPQGGHPMKTSGSYPQAGPMTSSGRYPQGGNPMTSSGRYPQAQIPPPPGSSPSAAPPWGAPPAAPPSRGGLSEEPSADYRSTLSEGAFGSTAILIDAPLMPAYSSNPAASSVPTFGPAPLPPSYPGLPVPGSGAATLTTGTLRPDLPISTEGLERIEPTQRKSAWREMPAPRKLMILLSPLLVAAVLVIFMGEELGLGPQPPQKGATGKPTAAPTAAAKPRPAPTAEATNPVAMQTAPPSTAAPADPSGAPQAAPPTAGVNAVPPPNGLPPKAGPPPNASVNAVPPPEPPPPIPPDPSAASEKAATGKTLQREAADAVAAGSFARAAEIYEQLAKKYPNKTAYAEAAAILRAKAGRKP